MSSEKYKKAILLVGTSKLTIDKVYKFCKLSYPEICFFRTINLPPKDGKGLGIPLPNVLYNDAYGPFSRVFLFEENISVLYFNDMELCADEINKDKVNYYFSVTSSTAFKMLDKYNRHVEKFKEDSRENTVSKYNSFLKSKK